QEIQFPLASGGFDPNTARDIVVLPGLPHSVAISRKDRFDNGSGVAIYDDGVPRPNATSYADFVGAIEPGPSSSILYGYNSENSGAEFSRLRVDVNGLTVLDKTPGLAIGNDISYVGGR